jgi:LysM repeat protein
VHGREWQRYAAPAAFLLAATIAVVAVRSGLEAGGKSSLPAVSVPTTPRKHIATKTAVTTPKKKPKAGGRRFWSVQAGDTFAVIASKSGVPVATLQHLNPKVRSTSLFIGEKLRLR